MNILYIDRANNIENIRIAEQIIFNDYLKRLGNKIIFLLVKTKGVNVCNDYKTKIYYRKNTFIIKKQISLDLVLIIAKGLVVCKTEKIDVIVARKRVTSALAGMILSKILRKKFVYLLSFPTWENIKQKKK